MTRRMELEILITSLVSQIYALYDKVRFDQIDKYLGQHDKIGALQLQVNEYVKELKQLSK